VDQFSGSRPKLNLDQFQSSQAATRRKTTNETVDTRIPETYQWLIVPGQPDPQGQPEWTEYRLQGEGALANRVSRKLKAEELLMVEMGGSRLRHEIDGIPLWRGDHVPIRQLCEDMARYLYLPRIKNEGVILTAIRDATERLTWQGGWPGPRGILGRSEAALSCPAGRPDRTCGRRPRQPARETGCRCRPA